jgi:hypothetical protein
MVLKITGSSRISQFKPESDDESIFPDLMCLFDFTSENSFFFQQNWTEPVTSRSFRRKMKQLPKQTRILLLFTANFVNLG